MVLSGTLREFILADVMQLLTQQKITGKLILSSNKNEGIIVFKNGSIVAASRDTETFSSKLFVYLTIILQQPRNRIRELFSSCEGKIADLTATIEKNQLMNHRDLDNYATSVTIDIACSLFLWSTGSYHFESLKTVDSLIPAQIDLPVENVVMEAMRRIDEWHRMREAITEESIFTPTGKPYDQADAANPLEDPCAYYLEQINGIKSVKALLENSFQTEYKVYESCYILLQSEAIKPLSESLTKSVRAAIHKNEFNAATLPPLVSIFISIALILGIFLSSWLFRGVFFQNLNIESVLYKNQTSILTAEIHEKEAWQCIQLNCIAKDPKDCERETRVSITKRDAYFLELKRSLMHKSQ